VAWLLYKIGRWCFSHRVVVIAGWLLVLVGTGVGAGTLSGPTQDSFSLPGLESTRAFDLIKERTPQAVTDGATAQVVIQARPGQQLTTDAVKKQIAAAVKTATTAHVTGVTDPFTAGTVTSDGRTAYLTVNYDRPTVKLDAADKDAMDRSASALRADGLTAVVGGSAFPSTEVGSSAEVAGIVIALVVLAITFGSLLAAGMSLLTALIGVGIGLTGITTLTGFVELSSTTPVLALMLGLAVGIDYSLFVMSRYRQEVKSGRSREDAMGVAIGTAGSAVVFAGLTVVIALVGLAVCNISFLTQMGLGGAATVAVAVLIALTLLPAVVGLGGSRVTGGRRGLVTRWLAKRAGTPGSDEGVRTVGRRWADFVVKHRVSTLLAGLGVAVVVSIPVLSMEIALPDDGSAPAGTGQRQAYDLISQNFGAGANGPLLVVVDTQGAKDPVAAVQAATAIVDGVHTDITTVVPAADPSKPSAVAALRQQLQAVNFASITVIPRSGPSAADTKQLVSTLRNALAGLESQTGARALVTGTTAVGVDIAASLSSALPIYLIVVVGLAFVLLLLVFRSLLVPLKAALGFVISVGVSLGTTVAVFQWGWLANLIGLDTTGPVVFLLPLLLTGILFGLAMDYEVFLVTRMREEFVHGTPARQAIAIGFQHSARVVTAAAIIMIGVFGAFSQGDNVIIKSIGFGLAVGVLADAFLVRMMIVPALMAIVGRHMWSLPRWLDRILPNLDIEGQALTRHLEEQPAVPEKVDSLR
jgi:RND superfamily putative drug exporter